MYQTMFPQLVSILQNEDLSIVKSFKHDYEFVELVGRWVRGR